MLGLTLLVYGSLNDEVSYVNLGLAGIFLSIIVYTFKTSEYVKKNSFEISLEPLGRILNSLISDLALEGEAIYVPPFGDLSKGGVFIPLHRDFELDLTRLSYDVAFLTSTSSEREMGVFVVSPGERLVERYEEHYEGSLEGLSSKEVESVCHAVLKSLELAKSIYIKESENEIEILVESEIGFEGFSEQLLDPLSSSILSALAKATGELLRVRKYKSGERIEIKAEKMGRPEKWM